MGQGIYQAVIFGEIVTGDKGYWKSVQAYPGKGLRTSYEASKDYVGFLVAVCDPGLADFEGVPLLFRVVVPLDQLGAWIEQNHAGPLAKARENWQAFVAHMAASGAGQLSAGSLLFLQDYD